MRSILLLIAVAVLAGPSLAEAPKPRPVGIVYWGNANTGVAVRVVNRVDGDKIAEAEVKKIGGDGWTLLVNSNTPGFGAAMCVRKGGSVIFHTANGYPSFKEALAAAQAKAKAAGGMASSCSRGQWSVQEISDKPPPSPTVIDTVKGKVRKMVVCSQSEKLAVKLPPDGSVKPAEAKADCAKFTDKREYGAKYPCMCVRG